MEEQTGSRWSRVLRRDEMLGFPAVSLGGWLGDEEDYWTCRNGSKVDENNHVRGLRLCRRLGTQIISSSFTHIQTEIDRLNRNGKETGICTKKTKFRRINAKNTNAVVVDRQEKEDVDVDYLGARLTQTWRSWGLHQKPLTESYSTVTAAFNKLEK